MHSEDNIQALRRPDSIARLMLRLHETCAPLVLMYDDGGACVRVGARGVDAACSQLLIDGLDGEDAASLAGGREIHAQAVIDGIQTWFTLTGLVGEQGGAGARLDFPDVVYRLQRRAALRVRPPQARAGARIAIASCELNGSMQDISSTGVCLRFARAQAAFLAVGSVLECADIRCDCGLDVQVRLEVVNLREADGDAVLVGMRFLDLASATQGAIERAVHAIQREMLALD